MLKQIKYNTMLSVEKFISRIKDEVGGDDMTIYTGVLSRYTNASLMNDGNGGYVMVVDGLVYDINGICNRRVSLNKITDDEVISMLLE